MSSEDETSVRARRLVAGLELESRARWGQVGYEGTSLAPPPAAYACLDAHHRRYATVHDSGRVPEAGSGLGNLYPLVAASLYEAAFASEAGPLSTWRN